MISWKRVENGKAFIELRVEKVRFLFAVAMVFAVAGEQGAVADCKWGPGNCGGSWVVTSKPASVDDASDAVENEMKGCGYPGETPPKDVTCTLKTTTETVKDRSLTGSLTSQICSAVGITIGGKLNTTSTVTVAGGVSATLTSFCQTCKAENGVSYIGTEYDVKCTCGATSYSGQVLQYDKTYTRGSTGLQPNPPCNPICPSGG